jgi:hypothetical protein
VMPNKASPKYIVAKTLRMLRRFVLSLLHGSIGVSDIANNRTIRTNFRVVAIGIDLTGNAFQPTATRPIFDKAKAPPLSGALCSPTFDTAQQPRPIHNGH